MTATLLTPGMLSNYQTSEILHNRLLPGSGPLSSMTAFFYSVLRLQLPGGIAFITQSYNPIYKQGLCLVHLSAKGKASKKIVCEVNERVMTVILKQTLRSSETSALAGGGLVGTQRREKLVTSQGLL